MPNFPLYVSFQPLPHPLPAQHSAGTTPGLCKVSPGLILGLGHTKSSLQPARVMKTIDPPWRALTPELAPALGCCWGNKNQTTNSKTTNATTTNGASRRPRGPAVQAWCSLRRGCNSTISEGATTEKRGLTQQMGSSPEMFAGSVNAQRRPRNGPRPGRGGAGAAACARAPLQARPGPSCAAAARAAPTRGGRVVAREGGAPRALSPSCSRGVAFGSVASARPAQSKAWSPRAPPQPRPEMSSYPVRR